MAGKIIKVWFIFLLVVLGSAVGWAGDNQSKKEEGANPNSAIPLYKKVIINDADITKAIIDEQHPGIHPSAGVSGVFKNPLIKPSPTTSPHFDTVGTTYYTIGANDRLQRHVTLSTLNYTHAAFTRSPDSTQQPRNIFYSAWFNTGLFPQSASEIQVSDLIDGEEGRGGFTMVTSFPDGRAVVVYHRAFPREPDSLPRPGTYLALETTPAAGDFSGNEFHVPDSVPPMRDEGIWPDGAGQKVGDSNFVHVVLTEGNYDPANIPTRYFAYVRGRETSPNLLGGFSTPRIVDTLRGYLSPTIVASQKSSKVAIIWVHPRKGYPYNPSSPESLGVDADLYYIESHVGGADWIDGFQNDLPEDGFKNITNYVDSDPLRASGDLTAAYDEEDSLVITFYAPQFVPKVGISRAQGAVYFWRKGIGGGGSDLKEVFNASIADVNVSRLTELFPATNPMIGIYKGAHPDSVGDYYILWTAAGGPDDTTENRGPLEGFWNYDIYCSASTNNGFSWSSVSNLTNSHLPACSLGKCDINDTYASLARTINDTLHITYINNRVPQLGGQTLISDSSRLAYVFYLKSPAKFVQKDTLASVSPSDFDDFDFDQGVTNDTFLFIANAGNQNLTINSIVADNPNASASVVNYPSPPFTILEGGAPAKITLTIDGSALPCSAYAVTWTFNTNAENSNLGNPKGVFKAKAEFALTTPSQPFFKVRTLTQLDQIVQVNNTRLSVGNSGTVGGAGYRVGMAVLQGDSSLHFLSQGTAYFAALLSNGDTLVARDIYEEAEFHPLYIPGALSETIQVIDTTITDSVSFATAMAQARPAKPGDWKIVRVCYAVYINEDENYPTYDSLYPWPGPWLGYWFCDQWWWKNTATYKWVVWYRQRIKKDPPCWWPQWPGQPQIASQMYDGIAMDWDPFSDSLNLSTGVSLPINNAAYNDTFKMAYAQGRGVPFDKRYAAQVFLVDTTKHLDNTNFSNDGIYGAHVISFEKYAAQYGGYRTRDLWRWVTKSGTGANTDTVHHDFIPNKTDVTILTTAFCSDTTQDTVAYAQGMAVSALGLDTLKKTVNEMRTSMSLIPIPVIPCTDKPGDFNGNGTINLTDIVGLVGHVFKGAAQPVPKCRGDFDANTILNLTDIVKEVSFVFKNGPKPISSGVCCKPTP